MKSLFLKNANDRSAYFGRYKCAMQKLAKNSKLVISNHAGHLSNLEQPIQWNQAVIDFFNKG